MLHGTFHEVEGEFFFAQYSDVSSKEEVNAFLQKAINDRCEGLMVKPLVDDSFYVPNKRNWLKIKKDYLEGVTDTLDLVPIGAYYGKGKRVGVYGAYLLACYDKSSDTFQSITKIGTGFSDEDLSSHFKSLSPSVVKSIPENYKFASSLKPDVLFSPSQVWEVLAADLSLSPVHLAAMGTVHKTKGIALRFPRFIRLRPDKSPKDCTDAEQVVQLFKNQSVQQ
jgi:DNA ligase-1